MPIVVPIVNQKGGVGKTTASISLGAAAALDGLKVLIVDFDPQANATANIGIKGIEKDDIEISVQDVLLKKVSIAEAVLSTETKNLFILPANINLDTAVSDMLSANFRESLLKNIIKSTDYDLILVDCNPSINLLTINAIYASDYILIPLTLEKNALNGFSNVLNTIKNIKPNDFEIDERVRLILNKYDKRTSVVNEWVNDQIVNFEHLKFKTIIGVDEAFKQAEVLEQPILLSHPKSNGAKNVKDLYQEFKGLCLN